MSGPMNVDHARGWREVTGGARGVELGEAIVLRGLIKRLVHARIPKSPLYTVILSKSFWAVGVCLFNQEVDLCLIPAAPLQSAMSLGGSPAQKPDCCLVIYVIWEAGPTDRSVGHGTWGLRGACDSAWHTLAQHQPWSPSALLWMLQRMRSRSKLRGCWGLIHSIIYSTNSIENLPCVRFCAWFLGYKWLSIYTRCLGSVRWWF